MSESEYKTYKLYIAAHASPILDMLPGFIQECRAGWARLCSVVGISQVARIVIAVRDAKQAALAYTD